MSNPQDKAEELVDKMYYSRKYKDGEDYIPQEAWVHAKQCALIAVDEIIQAMDSVMLPNPFKQYWNKVKQEIEKL